MAKSSFRGNKSVDLAKSGITEEFVSPQVSIQRFIVAAKGEIQTVKVASPRLLIAFSRAAVRTANLTRQLRRGDIDWIDANGEVQIEKADLDAAHVLAITFAK